MKLEVYEEEKEFFSKFAKYLRSLNLEDGFYHFSIDILQTKKNKDLHFYKQTLVPTTEKKIWK